MVPCERLFRGSRWPPRSSGSVVALHSDVGVHAIEQVRPNIADDQIDARVEKRDGFAAIRSIGWIADEWRRRRPACWIDAAIVNLVLDRGRQRYGRLSRENECPARRNESVEIVATKSRLE